MRSWAKDNLQLNDEQAEKFTKIHVPQGYASLSLNTINKVLPYLRAGYRYDEAVFLGNLKTVIGKELWNDINTRTKIENDICIALEDYPIAIRENETKKSITKKDFIANILLDNYGIPHSRTNLLYHPSQVEGYKDAEPNMNGIIQLGSPRTSSVRNPMAMRALFRLRALINKLLSDKKIDKETRINIELARELNDANKRAAIKQYQEELEKKHKDYAEEIKKLYREATNSDIIPTEDDILKYQLWEEQKHKCLYTGKEIGIRQFIGSNNSYDIEHTVPRSRGGDNSQANKTLCCSTFNRDIKRTKLPLELSNHKEVIARIESLGWEEKIEQLEKQISLQIKRSKAATTKESKDAAIKQRHYLKMKLDYWRNKLQRFKMAEITDGFTNRQGVDIGIIGRYARMYLQTAFSDVHTVKGMTTADFRKMWGLQEEYTKKERINHVHHCIDAITIACIDREAYRKWNQFICATEYNLWDNKEKPTIEKPWQTFTEDVKNIAEELLVSHHTPDNMPKRSKKKLRKRGGEQVNINGDTIYVQGDTARGSLHLQTFYGAIKRDDEIKYVVRKALSSLKPDDIKKIVDEAVRNCVEEAIKREGFKEAMSKPICFNREKDVYIKKVRIYMPTIKNPIYLKTQRDLSHKEYKQHYYVANESNYCMAIYEGTDEKAHIKRNFKVLSNLEAANYFNRKNYQLSIVPLSDENDFPLKYILKTGTMVLFYENSPKEIYECSNVKLVKRLYKIKGISTTTIQGKYNYGIVTFIHHQEARPAGDLKTKKGEWKNGEDYRPIIELYHTQFKALVEGYDFELSITGEITFKHSF